MLDWKILGASFVALLAVSSVFVGSSFGAGDIFTDIMDQISGWLEGSPFGGFLSAPTAQTKHFKVSLYPQTLILEPEEEMSMTGESLSLSGFKGTLEFNFVNKFLNMKEKDSNLEITAPLSNMTITNLKMKTLELENLDFAIEDTVSNNGSINIANFLGTLTINLDSIVLEGNVSKVSAKIGDMNWELS